MADLPKPAASAQHPKLVSELLTLNQRLLESIFAADWKTYENLCDPSISCFEPEARGRLAEGMAFHKYYFDLGKPTKLPEVTMASPHVRLLGENAAVVSYTRLVQKLDAAGAPITTVFEETRVWEKQAGGWKHVHFHRSINA